MSAGKYNMLIEKGADFKRTITWKDSLNVAINLTGYSAALQIRAYVNSPTTLLSLTSGSGLTLGGAAGTIAINITNGVTSALPGSGGVYQLEVTSGSGVVTRLLEGRVSLSPEVVR